jgi:hypothetical protein
MTYRLKVVTQLGHDGPWSGSDCWVASTRGLIAFASNGKVRLDPETVRKRAGKWVANPSAKDIDRLGPANLPDLKAVFKHPDTIADFKAAGLKPPRVRYLGYAKGAQVRTYLVKGYQAAVAISYKVINDLKPGISGDPAFNGFHSVRLAGAYDDAGHPRTALGSPFWTDQLDPLDDGRRKGIAKGVQRINGRFLALETAPIAGKGRIQALVVKRAERLHDHQDPPPADPCSEQVAALTNQLDAANAEIGRREGIDRQLLVVLREASAPVNAAITILSDPSNAGEIDQ